MAPAPRRDGTASRIEELIDARGNCPLPARLPALGNEEQRTGMLLADMPDLARPWPVDINAERLGISRPGQ
jgi:hypothetical protein